MDLNDKKRMFQHWTPITRVCYYRHMICDGCPNDTEFVCRREPWNTNPYGIRNIKYATIQILKNIGEPERKICKHDWEYIGTIDRSLPYGEIESKAVFKCRICGEEIEKDSYNKSLD